MRSRSPVMKVSGALVMAGAVEWLGLAVTACVRLLRSQSRVRSSVSSVGIPEMIG